MTRRPLTAAVIGATFSAMALLHAIPALADNLATIIVPPLLGHGLPIKITKSELPVERQPGCDQHHGHQYFGAQRDARS